MDDFTQADRADLARRGISLDEARRQLQLLAHPPPAAVLDRPCAAGDGIERISPDRHGALIEGWLRAAGAGRLSKFVPASGAASRMFQFLAPLAAADVNLDELRRRAAAGDEVARPIAELVDNLADLALAAEVGLPGSPDDAALAGAIRRMLSADGLDLPARPKALLPFHHAADGTRTAFDEHLAEAADTVRDAGSICRVHFTILVEHRAAFERAAARAELLASRLGVTFDVSFSVQAPHTDTIAGAPDGGPFRDDDGRLLFRPGGHGALLHNLDALGGDVVLVKNIDNVVPDHRRAAPVMWKRILAGLILDLEAQVHDLVRRLRDGDEAAVAPAVELCRQAFGMLPEERVPSRAWALDRLDRPLRACGVVLNQGEPGGGPYWVREPDGTLTRQIVESAQVDLRDPAQRALFQGASHFNPVDLVCCLRDAAGRPFALYRFQDQSAVFLARKSHRGRDLLALERPGLWNGAMARWNTVFVEVPAETFAPVKTLLDLLRPAHR